MAAQIVCSYFKFGYCKHREYCRKRHVKEICELSSCEISNCDKRHPIKCKYYRDYGKCKFDPCMFSHVKDDDGIDALKKDLENVVVSIDKMERNINELDSKLLESQTIIERLTIVETKLEKIDAAENNVNTTGDVNKMFEKLNKLEEKLDKLETKEVHIVQTDEKNHIKKKNSLERHNELEKLNEEKDSQIILLKNKLEKLEAEVKDT